MRAKVATDADAEPAPGENLVLTVSRDGAVEAALEVPAYLRQHFATREDGLTLNDIWDSTLAAHAVKMIRASLRSRRLESNECADSERVLDVTAVPQGRNRVLLIARDISRSKSDLSAIRRLAYTDETTGLPNREYLLLELEKITETLQLKGGRAALVCLYVRPFSDHGYSLTPGEEDEVLEQLAARLTAEIRGINDPTRSDASRFTIVARTYFRQFTIAMPSIESADDAEALTTRLIVALEQPVAVNGRNVATTAKGGIALFPQDGTNADALYANAISAAEDANRSSSSSFKLHSGTVRLRSLQRQDLAAELRTALDREDFELSFLPVISAADSSVRSVEALLRWPETILGSQPTRRVVTVAEHTGLIVPIGRWVLRKACELLASWSAAGHERLRMAVNLSVQEFAADDLVDRMAVILQSADVDPTHLDVEIKEHMLFRDATQGYAMSRRLADLGVNVVIDDFGTGTCSLWHLAQSPARAIKIDNSLVMQIETCARSRAACAAAIALGNKLDMQVIAEGVETSGQADVLRGIGCEYLQGFVYGEPLPADRLLGFLDAHGRALDEAGVS